MHLSKYCHIFFLLKLSEVLTQGLGLTGLSIFGQKEDTVYQFNSEHV